MCPEQFTAMQTEGALLWILEILLGHAHFQVKDYIKHIFTLTRLETLPIVVCHVSSEQEIKPTKFVLMVRVHISSWG